MTPEAPTYQTIGNEQGWRPDARLLVAVALITGGMLRIFQYAFNRSLWLDEALFSPQVTDQSLASLLTPGNWGAVPPGFMVLTKLAVMALGETEYALRLVPLLAGLASLPLFYLLATRVLGAGRAGIATALFALSPFLIYYASELKQYSSDVLVTLMLLIFAVELARKGVTTSRAVAWTVMFVAAAVFSLTSIFVATGATLALLLKLWRAGEVDQARRIGISGIVVALMFAVPYLLFVNTTASNDYLQAFWRDGFMPLPPTTLADLAWFPRTFARIFRDPLGVATPGMHWSDLLQGFAAMLAFAFGAFWLYRRDRTTVAILLLPVGVTLVASGLHKYPFGGGWESSGRVILFLTPVFFLIIGEGANRLMDVLGGRAVVQGAFLAALLLPLVAWGVLAVPQPRAELKPLLQYVQEEWQPGDVLYVHYDTRQTFDFYAPKYGFRQEQYVLGPCARFDPGQYLTTLSELRRHNRIWVLFTGGVGAYGYDEKDLVLTYLEEVGTRVEGQVAYGTSVHLFDIRAAGREPDFSSIRIPVLPPQPEQGCAIWG